MFRLFLLLMTLTFLPFSALSEESLTFAEPLTGVYTWPEGSSEAAANYVYRYTYPQLSGESDVAIAFNNIFQYEVSDALGFECPMLGSIHPADAPQMQVSIACTITHMGPEYLSVRIDKQVVTGDQISNIIKAYTFTLTGQRAGTVTSLPYMLGLLKDGENDEWYINRQIDKADTCTRDMVWQLISQNMESADSTIYEDMTVEEFEAIFYPEEDFYLDESGNFVFFLQENAIAPADAGQFFYTLTLDEILDEI